jgi:hypothetical protein
LAARLAGGAGARLVLPGSAELAQAIVAEAPEQNIVRAGILRVSYCAQDRWKTTSSKPDYTGFCGDLFGKAKQITAKRSS